MLPPAAEGLAFREALPQAAHHGQGGGIDRCSETGARCAAAIAPCAEARREVREREFRVSLVKRPPMPPLPSGRDPQEPNTPHVWGGGAVWQRSRSPSTLTPRSVTMQWGISWSSSDRPRCRRWRKSRNGRVDLIGKDDEPPERARKDCQMPEIESRTALHARQIEKVLEKKKRKKNGGKKVLFSPLETSRRDRCGEGA